MSRYAVLAACLLAAGIGLVGWWTLGRPVHSIDVAAGGKLACVSYAPFRRGQSPFEPGIVIPRWQIEEDLAVLAERSACVRTYSIDQGLDQVPAVARAVGLKVMLGLWIGREAAKNEAELAKGIALANRHPETVSAVIVGNEVLLRREQPEEAVAAMVRRVKQAVPMPVTYADVWEFWLQHRSVADAVDFVTVHLLPYWEDDPHAIDDAIPHLLAVHGRMVETFPGRPVMIGEVGWPSAGRQREGAEPGRVNQARFVREFLAAAAERGLRYNLIEAFDQPWKRLSEGTVGGQWGLWDVDRQPKFPLRGPVAEVEQWWLAVAFALVVGIAFARRPFVPVGTGRPGRLAALAAAAAAGSVLAHQLWTSWLAARDVAEWIAFIGCTLATLGATAFLARAAAAGAEGKPWPYPPMADLRAVFAAPLDGPPYSRLLATLRGFTLFAAAGVSLALVFDPRYRDFPVSSLLVPTVLVALAALFDRRRGGGRAGPEEVAFALVLLATAPIVAARETFANDDALSWIALTLVLAGATLAPALAAVGDARTPEQAREAGEA